MNVQLLGDFEVEGERYRCGTVLDGTPDEIRALAPLYGEAVDVVVVARSEIDALRERIASLESAVRRLRLESEAAGERRERARVLAFLEARGECEADAGQFRRANALGDAQTRIERGEHVAEGGDHAE
jgi:hypothetical protein